MQIQIEQQLHLRLGKAQNNFPATLPPADSDLATQIFKGLEFETIEAWNDSRLFGSETAFSLVA